MLFHSIVLFLFNVYFSLVRVEFITLAALGNICNTDIEKFCKICVFGEKVVLSQEI